MAANRSSCVLIAPNLASRIHKVGRVHCVACGLVRNSWPRAVVPRLERVPDCWPKSRCHCDSFRCSTIRTLIAEREPSHQYAQARAVVRHAAECVGHLASGRLTPVSARLNSCLVYCIVSCRQAGLPNPAGQPEPENHRSLKENQHAERGSPRPKRVCAWGGLRP